MGLGLADYHLRNSQSVNHCAKNYFIQSACSVTFFINFVYQ